MEGEQFSLCWNNFHTNLSSGFQNLYKEEDLVDVTLAAEGKFIKAHKTVLSICSPYFKELFRVNPCKHPIVILQDVNFNALCSLLQFMYEGQVSVSQEEIPIFMKVAETLKIKGLTDNGSSKFDANGINNSLEQRNIPKKQIRPIKKPIIKPFRSSGSPGIQRTVKSPMVSSQQPPAKKIHLSDDAKHSTSIEPLLKPKIEPVDDDTTHSFNEEQFDVGNASLGTATPSTSTPEINSGEAGWCPENYKQPDTSTPDVENIFFLKSRKGQVVLVHDGHIYVNGDEKNGNQWICVKNKSNNCRGSLLIYEGPIIYPLARHNHIPLNDVIRKLPLV